MKLLYTAAITLLLLCSNNIVFLANPVKNKTLNTFTGLIGIVLANIIFYIILQYFNVVDFPYFFYISILSFVISAIIFIVYRHRKDKEKKEGKKIMQIVLEHKKGKIIYRNPYNGFLVYGGAEAGKTSSIGKPLLKQYMLNGFAGFIYDAKENDYTLTAHKIKEDINYPYPIYNLDFLDPSRSYRTNIFCPEVITDPQLVPEFAELFFSSFLADDEKKETWYKMGLGVFKAVAWNFYTYYPKKCSLPHICNFISQNDGDSILKFVMRNETSKNYASSLINAQGSEKTFSSILTTVSNFISDFSANRNAAYILSGDDFLYNPLDPENPKMICVSNHFRARNIISPLVVLLFCTIARQIKFSNKIPTVFFMDEATTFKIPELESYPSELREYLVSFVLLTQSAGKIEKKYNKFDRSSLESNLANQYYGWTADTIALDNYAKQFSKAEEKTKSITTGEGRGKSTTTATRKDIRYDGEFFGRLKPGEFVGKAKNANVRTFHTRFKQYTGGKLVELPIIREVTAEDIERAYQKIIYEVTHLD
jgi:hypothetical protein